MWPFTLWQTEQGNVSDQEDILSHQQELNIERDALRGGRMAAISAVLCQPQLQPGETQGEPFFVDENRNELCPEVVEELLVGPSLVIVNLYDLSENFVRANAVTGLQAGAGGAFHCGVEVYGGEWSYGTFGVVVDPPRLQTHHIYSCSLILGTTRLQALEVGNLLHELAETWRAIDYNILSCNCCSFAHDVCKRLGVDRIPAWIDRFARLGHQATHCMPVMCSACVRPSVSKSLTVDSRDHSRMSEDVLPDFDFVDIVQPLGAHTNQLASTPRRVWKVDRRVSGDASIHRSSPVFLAASSVRAY